MKIFCCERFENYYYVENTTEEMARDVYPNIKIIKLKPNKHDRPGNEMHPYRFLLVCGFMKDKPPFVNLKFCPFCGTDLFKFYNASEFVNFEDVFFV